MSKVVSRAQALQVSARVATQVNWDELDSDQLQSGIIDLSPEEFGRRFTAFIKNSGRMVVGEHAIDLSSPCRLPFSGAVRMVHRGKVIVKLERRGDDLYIDGQKVNRFLSEEQKGNGRVEGNVLRAELEARGGNLSAKVLDYLEDNPELWPESWKIDDNGYTNHFVLFWDDIFSRQWGDHLYVRYGHWYGGRVLSDYCDLDHGLDRSSPAASIAS